MDAVTGAIKHSEKVTLPDGQFLTHVRRFVSNPKTGTMQLVTNTARDIGTNASQGIVVSTIKPSGQLTHEIYKNVDRVILNMVEQKIGVGQVDMGGRWAGTVFNFVYADSKGNVGYQMAGRVPVRGRVTHGLRDANNPDDRWTGHIPFDALPYSYNPKRGYVASANQRIVPPNYPLVIYGAYSQAHRGIRINQVFAEGNWDTAASIRLQNDVKSVRSERVVPGILKALKGATSPEAKIVSDALKGWDFNYTTASIAPTVFETFMFHWQRRVVAEHMPDRLIDLTMQQTNLACHLLEKPSTKYFKTSIAEEAAKAAKQAVETLKKRLGTDQKKWNWGAIHIAHWKHPLSDKANAAKFDVGPMAADGGSHTVRNMGGELPPHAASSGAEYRIVVDFAKPGSFRATQNIGNSGVPGNPHYRDQFEPFIKGEYHTVHLKRAAIEAELESRMEIQPA